MAAGSKYVARMKIPRMPKAVRRVKTRCIIAAPTWKGEFVGSRFLGSCGDRPQSD
jgi:hypothetical protein